MRRFWAHITIILTALLVMGTTFFSIFSKASMNLEYQQGIEVTYRITDKDDPDLIFEDDTAVKEIAALMQERLDNVGVTDYNVKTVGYDIVKVQFAEPNDVNKNNIVAYLGFNGSLALSNMDDDESYLHIIGSEFLLENSKAYLDDINSYPTIVIPINKESPEFQDLVSRTEDQHERGVGEQTETGENDESGNPQTVTTTYLYLWYDFDEQTDSYSKTVSTNSDYDVTVANKIIMKFNIEELYYPDGQDNKLAASLNMDADGSGAITTTEVRNSYNNARFYVNLLNSSVLNYEVTFITDETITFIPATTEQLINYGDPHQTLNASRTLIATICGIVISALLLAFFLRLPAASIVVSTLLSLFASLGFMVAMNAEFNIGALIALIAIALISLASGIVYCTKLKNEIYHGRTLKKGNSEAARKSLWLTVDFHIVLVIIGVFSYLFGGTLMRTFALISVVGGIASLLISLLFFRLLMWLITNNTAFTNKLSLFGVKEDKLPTTNPDGSKSNIYEGAYQNVDLNKNHKVIGIVSLVVCVASLAGLITFGALNNNLPLASATPAPQSELYVYSTNEMSTLESVKSSLLNQVMIYENNSNEGKLLATYVSDETSFAHTDLVEGVEKRTYYFEFSVSNKLNENTSAQAMFLTGSSKQTLKEVLEEYNGFDAKSNASIKASTIYKKNQANFGGIALGTGIATLILGLYFILRYKLSRGITTLITALGVTIIGFGIFSLTRIAFPTVTSVAIPLIALFAFIISLFIINKDKELVSEDKAREIDFIRRSEIMTNATRSSFNEILILAIVSCYLGIVFFGVGPTANSLIFILITISFILGTFLITNLLGPIAQLLYKGLSPVENKRPKKIKKKKTGNTPKKSSEPEEATFIGIND